MFLKQGLIRVVATMSEAMGPIITDAELKAITKTANLFETEDASLQVGDKEESTFLPFLIHFSYSCHVV